MRRPLTFRPLGLALALFLFAPVVAGCGRELPEEPPATVTGEEEPDIGAFEEEALSGRIRVDGSSTVGPFATFAAERFRKQEPGVRVTVGVAGTGGGFERFCAGETDISNASRPIAADERELCTKKGIEFVELHVANDGLTVVANARNDWVDCLTVEQLKRIWEPGSKVDNWREVEDDFPDERLTLYGAGTDSGTFDYFTEAIVGEEGKSRSDYSQTEDDNVTVRGVSGERGALGYFGLSYFEENREKLKALQIDGGDGCVAPNAQTVQDGSYKPLSRPLFMYVKTSALSRTPVERFLEFLIESQRRIARAARFVPLTDDQAAETRQQLQDAALVSG